MQDPYSRENILAAINLIGGLSNAEKRALLEKMTADVGRLAAEAKEQRLTQQRGVSGADQG